DAITAARRFQKLVTPRIAVVNAEVPRHGLQIDLHHFALRERQWIIVIGHVRQPDPCAIMDVDRHDILGHDQQRAVAVNSDVACSFDHDRPVDAVGPIFEDHVRRAAAGDGGVDGRLDHCGVGHSRPVIIEDMEGRSRPGRFGKT
ncbi:MAG: hypothetical protein ACK56I_19005, partial [bacterium]